MRTVTTTIFLILCTLLSIAQPTLTQNLKYNIGDSVTVDACDTTGMSAAMTTGANVTWTINLTTTGSGTVEYIDKSASSFSSQFPNTNIVEKWPTGVEWFYEKTATAMRSVGQASGSGATGILSPSYRSAVWPFTYNDSYADTVAISYPQSPIGNGTVYFKHTADAYGTLVLNGKTYTNVLRTKSNNDGYDLSNNPVESIEYIRFWDEAHKTPILSIRRYEDKTGTNPPSYQILILKEEKTTGIKDAKRRLVNINAHTLNGQLYLKGELQVGKEYQLHLYNYAGQIIKSQAFTAKGQQFTTSIPDIPTGVYFIQLQERGEAPGYIKFFHQ